MVKKLTKIILAAGLVGALFSGCANNVWNTRRQGLGTLIAVGATANAMNAKTHEEAVAWKTAANFGMLEEMRRTVAAGKDGRREEVISERENKDRYDLGADGAGEDRESKIKTLWLGNQIYVGEVLNGKPHGRGKLQYPDGGWYEGGFRYGKREGFGRCLCSDGDLVEGPSHNDYFDGIFSFTPSGGKKETVYFLEGRLVSEEEFRRARPEEK